MTTTALTKKEQKINEAKLVLKTRIDKLMPQIAACVPRGVKPTTLVRFLYNALNANPDIVIDCSASSIADCLVRAASRGLEISDGMLGDCFLVPFGNTKSGGKEAVLIVGYKGIKKLVRNSGLGAVVMDHVRQGDLFCDAGLTHAYAAMVFQSGLVITKIMSRGELLAHRNRYANPSNCKKGKQWHEDSNEFPRMCEKTCVRQLAGAGDLPLSADDKNLLAADEEIIAADGVRTVDMPEQPQIESKPAPEVPPAVVDAEALFEAVKSSTTPLMCDDRRAQLIRNFPASKQEIYDAFEAKRESLMANEDPATFVDPEDVE